MTKQRGQPPENIQSPEQRIIRAQQTTIYKGQLPPPEMLEKFEAIQPGFTDRLLKMVEEESKFKREHDRNMLKSFKLTSILGIVFAFMSVITVSLVAVYAIFKGLGTAAASIMATCIVGVIIAFIQRRKATKAEK
jgi:uncharacterized membrane protein